MKKFSKSLIFAIAVMLTLSLALVACQKNCTVKFETNGGSSVESQTVVKGEKVAKPQDPEKTNFVFDGWYTNPAFTEGTEYDFSEPLEGNLTLYAKWKQTAFYTITVENGTGGGSFEQGSEITLTATVPQGKRFVKWTKDGADCGTTATLKVTVSANAVYAAVLEDEAYTVVYMLDGVVYDTQQYTFGQTIIAPVPEDTDDYRFLNWIDLPETMPAQSLTIVAGIQKLRAFVSVFGADGTDWYAVGTQLTLTATVPTGFEFDGWQIDEVTVGEQTSFTFSVEDDVEIFAVMRDVNSTDYFVYDNEIISAKSGATLPSSIILPAEYDGIAITAVASDGFKNRTSLTDVVLPASITVIGGSAFDGCSNLQSINLENVKTLGDYAFNRCPALLEAKLISLESSGQAAFLNAISLENVVFGENLQSIPSSMLEGCSSISEITLPDGISVVGAAAFKGCSELVTIEIGSGVVSIAGNALAGCAKLRAINVDELNETFSSVDGILFDKSGIILVLYPNGKTSAAVNIGEGIEIVYEHAFEGNAFVQTINLGPDVKEIRQYAFAGCTALVSFSAQNSALLSTIGAHAFDGCAELTAFTAPQTVVELGTYAFAGCVKLESVVFAGLTVIPDHAFNGCVLLSSAEFGSVTSVGDHAFNNCAALTSFDFTSVVELKNHAFNGCQALNNVFLGDSVSVLPEYVFNGCSSLSALTLPQSLNQIGQYALAGTALPQAVLPASLQTIGNSAFEGCESLSSVRLGQNTKTVGGSAFQNCISLSEISLNDGLEKIGSLAFANCTALFSVTIPESVLTVGEYAFLQNGSGLKILCVAQEKPQGWHDDWNFGGYEVVWDCKNYVENPDFSLSLSADETYYILNGFAQGRQTTELVLPSVHNGKPVKEIAADAFTMSGIVSLTIPSSYVKIGANAFYYCDKLAAITFNEGLKEIGMSAFRYCAVTTVQLPDGLETIGDGAFRDCSDLTEAYVPASVTTIGSAAFRKNASALVITCEVGEKPAGWNDEWNYDDAEVVWGGSGEDADTSSFTYKESADGTYYLIDGFAKGVSLANVVFPSEYNGKPVKGISDSMNFFGNESIISIVCPSSFEILSSNAFYGCANLESVVLNAGLKEIGTNAFRDCAKLSAIVIPQSVEIIGSGAFRGCKALTITCEIAQTEVPAGWDDSWNRDDCPVIWKDETSA